MESTRKVTLFIAMSLDGYIAKVDGNIDWLGGQEANENDMLTYNEFIKEIDSVVMGWNTYHQLVQDLSPEEWMYPNHTSYVVTHREMKNQENIKFVNEDMGELIRKLKQGNGKGIWICGGANIIQPLLNEKLIDRFHINIMPIILGGGIALFEYIGKEIKLNLIKSQSYNGITDVIYELR